MFNIRTDLAIEAREIYREGSNREVPGVAVDVDHKDEDIKITIVKVLDERGARIIGKPIGSYITMEVPKIRHYDAEFHDRLGKSLAKQLAELINLKKDGTVLVVGLGNWNVTPDSLGPKVVSKLFVTRHLKQYMPQYLEEGINPVCAISPGVLGITGIETAEIIQGVVEKVKPDVVIAIDALSSRKMERVVTTIQIGNTGINPGSGVGNRRMELSERTLGIPVIAIGVPTVVDAATLANDTIDLMIDSLIKQTSNDKDFYNMLKNVNKDEKYALIRQILNPYIGDLMVTPKEIDSLIEDISKVIANAINIAVHPGIELEDINKYIH
ncbi:MULTISPECIES: GPR endopeptidase [Caloramator]|uniref:Germination protease n=1 Tax=Caloramator australicus RC3 TaxID=857293 RepID=I7LKF3_9CLOT|nr:MULTISPECIES: GPR endopeptidase [Caloramator]MDO6354490.1 GPR endopeptidase [Caloramator sp. CAR-1]WDU84175.1 GPR endopeptidase [Caloramator sp. Dgby_cultured_2]CCJ34393.1 Endopeptidase spore protease Gpr [Caloramator australicus RC3]